MSLVSFCISWVLPTEEGVFPFWVNGCTTWPEPSPQWVPSQQVHVFHWQGWSKTWAFVGKVRSKSQGSHNRVCCVYGDHDGIFWSHLQDSHLWGLKCWKLTVGLWEQGHNFILFMGLASKTFPQRNKKNWADSILWDAKLNFSWRQQLGMGNLCIVPEP